MRARPCVPRRAGCRPHRRPPAAPAPADATVVASPTYVSIPMEIMVNRPAAEVWKRIGKYCDIGEWFQIPCTITQGKDGEFGAVRSVANEILVGKTELSYTYTQPVRAGRPYNLYHGTLEARPVTATTSKLVYTLVYDNSMLADDAAKERDRAQRTATFTRALQNMKTLAEGGTLPPPAPRAGGPGAAPGAAPGREQLIREDSARHRRDRGSALLVGGGRSASGSRAALQPDAAEHRARSPGPELGDDTQSRPADVWRRRQHHRRHRHRPQPAAPVLRAVQGAVRLHAARSEQPVRPEGPRANHVHDHRVGLPSRAADREAGGRHAADRRPGRRLGRRLPPVHDLVQRKPVAEAGPRARRDAGYLGPESGSQPGRRSGLLRCHSGQRRVDRWPRRRKATASSSGRLDRRLGLRVVGASRTVRSVP